MSIGQEADIYRYLILDGEEERDVFVVDMNDTVEGHSDAEVLVVDE